MENSQKVADIFNVSNKFTLQKIFNNLSPIILLNMIRYNNNLKKSLNKTIDDYKKNSSIIIEIVPFLKYENYTKGLIVINCDKKYCHVYFNDSKEEIKRNYFTNNDNVQKIKIVLDYGIQSLNRIFRQWTCIKRVDFIKFNRINISKLNNLFEGSSVEEINFYDFPENSVTDMSYMFYYCTKLKKLNISNFDTSNVTNMSFMFSKCDSLEKLDISNFDTSKVTDMSNMFSNCSSLNNLNIFNFDTSNVKNMSYMFFKCGSLEKLNISNFDTSKVTDMSFLFEECGKLEELDLSNFNTENVEDMSGMISKCYELKKINISSFNTKNVRKMEYLLSANNILKEIDVSNFSFDKVEDFHDIFSYNLSLKRIKMSYCQIEFAEKLDEGIKEKIMFVEE